MVKEMSFKFHRNNNVFFVLKWSRSQALCSLAEQIVEQRDQLLQFAFDILLEKSRFNLQDFIFHLLVL